MIYPADFTEKDIKEFEQEFNQWLDEERTVAERERKFLAENSVEMSEEIYSPFWGA